MGATRRPARDRDATTSSTSTRSAKVPTSLRGRSRSCSTRRSEQSASQPYAELLAAPPRTTTPAPAERVEVASKVYLPLSKESKSCTSSKYGLKRPFGRIIQRKEQNAC